MRSDGVMSPHRLHFQVVAMLSIWFKPSPFLFGVWTVSSKHHQFFFFKAFSSQKSLCWGVASVKTSLLVISTLHRAHSAQCTIVHNWPVTEADWILTWRNSFSKGKVLSAFHVFVNAWGFYPESTRMLCFPCVVFFSRKELRNPEFSQISKNSCKAPKYSDSLKFKFVQTDVSCWKIQHVSSCPHLLHVTAFILNIY